MIPANAYDTWSKGLSATAECILENRPFNFFGTPKQVRRYLELLNTVVAFKYWNLPAAGPESNLQSSPAQPTKDETQS